MKNSEQILRNQMNIPDGIEINENAIVKWKDVIKTLDEMESMDTAILVDFADWLICNFDLTKTKMIEEIVMEYQKSVKCDSENRVEK